MPNPSPVYILGISCYYHDSAAVLLKDGEIIFADSSGSGAAPEEKLREILRAARDAHPLRMIDPDQISAELLETLEALGYIW